MTSSEHSSNYMANTARMIGYHKGFTQAWLTELESKKNGLSQEDLEFFVGRVRNMLAITDKWFDLRNEGQFSSRDIERMLGQA